MQQSDTCISVMEGGMITILDPTGSSSQTMTTNQIQSHCTSEAYRAAWLRARDDFGNITLSDNSNYQTFVLKAFKQLLPSPLKKNLGCQM